MDEKDNKTVTIADVIEKSIKPKGRVLTKKELLAYFEVDEKALESYDDNQLIQYKDVIPKK